MSVHSQTRLIVECGVAARTDKSNNPVYQCDIADAHAKRSRFIIAETEDYKERTRGGYIGGGTFYNFSLIDFIDPHHKEEELQQDLKAAIKRLEKERKQVVAELPIDGDRD